MASIDGVKRDIAETLAVPEHFPRPVRDLFIKNSIEFVKTVYDSIEWYRDEVGSMLTDLGSNYPDNKRVEDLQEEYKELNTLLEKLDAVEYNFHGRSTK
jgi:hypothetical protein